MSLYSTYLNNQIDEANLTDVGNGGLPFPERGAEVNLQSQTFLNVAQNDEKTLTHVADVEGKRVVQVQKLVQGSSGLINTSLDFDLADESQFIQEDSVTGTNFAMFPSKFVNPTGLNFTVGPVGEVSGGTLNQWMGCYSEVSFSTGKVYFEFQAPADSPSYFQAVGIVKSDNSNWGPAFYDNTKTHTYQSNGSIRHAGVYIGGFSNWYAGERIGVLVDFDALSIKFYRNGVLQSSGTIVSGTYKAAWASNETTSYPQRGIMYSRAEDLLYPPQGSSVIASNGSITLFSASATPKDGLDFSTCSQPAYTTLSEANSKMTININTQTTCQSAKRINGTTAKKIYFEAVYNNRDYARIGIAGESYTGLAMPTAETVSHNWSRVHVNNTMVVNDQPIAEDGDRVMFAIDTSTDKFWVGVRGTWYLGGNPAAGTGASTSSFLFSSYTSLRIVAQQYGVGNAVTLKLKDSDFLYSPPVGFTDRFGDDGFTTIPRYVTTSDQNHFTISNLSISDINSVSIIKYEPTNTSVKALVSFDGRVTWNKFVGTTITPVSGMSFDSGCTTESLQTGMTNLSTTGKSFVDFAFQLSTTNPTVAPSLDQVTINYDENNSYVLASIGVDYDIQYLTATQTVIKKLSSGTDVSIKTNTII